VIKVWLSTLAVLGLMLLSPMPSRAQGDGVIQGKVINSTADSPVQGLEVVLQVFQGQSEGEALTITTDSEGSFRFEGLATDDDWAYLLRATFDRVVYSEGMLTFEPGQAELEADIQVYEATEEGGQISAERAHIFVTASEDSLLVTELYVFANPTDRTYIGKEEVEGRRWTSRFVLPEGSYNLSFEDGSLGARFLATEKGFVDTEPQWPGTTSVLFQYALDCNRGECNLDRELVHPISNLNVLIPDTGAQLEAKALTLQGRMEAQGQSYLNYAGSDLKPGEQLDLRLHLSQAGAPAAAPRGRSTSPQALPWIILVSVLAVLALAYPFWRRRIEAAARDQR
jgi:hypothetical protein